MKISRRGFVKTAGVAIAAGAARTAWPGSVAELAFGDVLAGKPTGFTLGTKRLMLRHTWTISRNSSDYKDNVFVCIERDGVKGWGESAPNVRYGQSTAKTLAALGRATNLFEREDWFEYVPMEKQWRGIIADQSCACAALDMALMDWVGNKLGVPLHKMLGLDRRKAPLTSFSIGIDTPEIVRRKVKEASQYPLLKIKVGRETDDEMLAAVRDVTNCPLRVDANEGWRDKRVALEKILRLQEMGVEFIEQPMPAEMLEETAWLRDRVDIPVIADEAVKSTSDIPKLAMAYDGINIKLMKSGGIQEAIRMIHVARAFGMKVMLGCMIASSVAISAAAQLSPMVDYADLDGNLLISNDPFQGVTVEQGRLILNDQPGLGVTELPT